MPSVNQVDATYRADLKNFNDLNFARFDAKLDAFRSEFDAKLDTLKVELIARMEAQLEKRLGEQTRFFFLAWAILLASNIALWFR